MKCVQILQNGQNCRANALRGGDRCFSHDPKMADRKLQAVFSGGFAPKKQLIAGEEEIRINSPKDAQEFVALVINRIWSGQLPASPIGSTLGFLIRVYLDAFEAAESGTRLEEIEKRLEEAGL